MMKQLKLKSFNTKRRKLNVLKITMCIFTAIDPVSFCSCVVVLFYLKRILGQVLYIKINPNFLNIAYKMSNTYEVNCR